MAHEKPLGRLLPPDNRHLELYPATDELLDTITAPRPVPAGIAWLNAFDKPEQGTDGRYRVKADHRRSIRGYHCICLEPAGEPDPEWAHAFYDQSSEGACEGFGNSRAVMLMHPEQPPLDAFWVYDDAQRVEGTYRPDGGSVDDGATNRGTGRGLVQWGAHRAADEFGTAPAVIQRVPWRAGLHGLQLKSYHWATSVEQLLRVLGYPGDTNEVPLLNSWGADGYPHRVYLPVDELAAQLPEGAEYSVFVHALD